MSRQADIFTNVYNRVSLQKCTLRKSILRKMAVNVAWWVKLPLGMPVSHTEVSVGVLIVLLPVQLPVLWETADDGSSA